MKDGAPRDLSSLSMAELFRLEVEEHTAALTEGLLALERAPATAGSPAQLEALMRAAHSLKGAARLIGHDPLVRLTHAMEDVFVAAQGGTAMNAGQVDVLLRGVDLIARATPDIDAARGPEADAALAATEKDVSRFLDELTRAHDAAAAPIVTAAPAAPAETSPRAGDASARAGSSVRVTADHLNRLLSLAGESLVASRWLPTLSADLLALKRQQDELTRALSTVRELSVGPGLERIASVVHDAHAQIARCQSMLAQSLTGLDTFDRRSLSLSDRLYREVLAARMRPFSDGVGGMPRLVRDVARQLGKSVRLYIEGETTPVDRDILQRLESPLTHLLRNAVDHGVESANERRQAGKPDEATVRLEARHSMGMLVVAVSDDGRGVNAETIRAGVVERGLASPDMASRLSEAELLDFLFLPRFTTAQDITEISGRGVGLDVVQTMVRDVGGRISVTSRSGDGMQVHLHLPLTLSVIRALTVAVGGEPYAIPLARVTRVLRLPRGEVQSVEGREHFLHADRSIGLVSARDVFGGSGASDGGDLAVVVIGDRAAECGLVVDAFLGEYELVLRALDPRLGKVALVSAAAILPDGSPVLVVDVDDVVRFTDTLTARASTVAGAAVEHTTEVRARRVLVADDSIIVRETERKLLQSAGYAVDVAVDGMDAWNAVRSGQYDLVLTDVDMPRLDGIELTKLIRKDTRLRHLPVMIVSYKDREEDRLRGLDAGADFYLTKASFHDDTLLRGIAQLLGGASQ